MSAIMALFDQEEEPDRTRYNSSCLIGARPLLLLMGKEQEKIHASQEEEEHP